MAPRSSFAARSRGNGLALVASNSAASRSLLAPGPSARDDGELPIRSAHGALDGLSAFEGSAARKLTQPPVERGTNADFSRSLRAHTSAALSRSRFLQQFGTAYSGLRDFYKAYGYKRHLTYEDYRFRYERDGIAGRIVDLPATDTWRSFPSVHDSPERSDPQTEFELAWETIADRLRLREAFERLDRLSGIGHYGVLLIGVRDGRGLDQPLGQLDGPDDVLYVAPYDEGAASIEKLVTNPSDERFGLPELYSINLAAPSAEFRYGGSVRASASGIYPFLPLSASTQRRTVHHSRIIHYAENALDNKIIGMPRLKRPWNYLDDLMKLTGGSAETFWLAANRGMQFDVDKELSLTPEDKQDLEEQYEEYEHMLRRMFRTRGVKISSLGETVANPRGIFSVTAAVLIGSCGIPLRMLFGTERGQIATVQDRTTWLEQIQVRQRVETEPKIIRPFIGRLVDHGAMPRPLKDTYKLGWPDLLASSDRDRAEIAHLFARAAADFARQKALGALIVDENEVRERYFNLSPRSDAEQAAVDKKIEEAQAARVGTKNPPQDAGARARDKQETGSPGGNAPTRDRVPKNSA